jgi:ParB family transcriptional regulator, chromosome partitioning protein
MALPSFNQKFNWNKGDEMVKHSGLGKGLEALIPGDDMNQETQNSNSVSIESIKPNPRQPRSIFKQEELKELAESIRENGIIQPLIISPAENPGEYYLVAGERRLLAAKTLGMESVPVIIRDVSDIQQLELALVENVQREDLSPLETAEAYRQLADDFSLSHDDIAKKVGKSRVTITNTIRLLKLPEEVLNHLRASEITEGHARAILALPTPESQIGATETVIRKSLNVRQTEQLVQSLLGQKKKEAVKPVYSSQVKEIEELLRNSLGTKVNLHYTPKGGSVVIRYYSDEELDSIINKITRK